MIRTLLLLIPRFVTEYLVVVEESTPGTDEGSFTGFLVEHPEEVPEDKTCFQLRYLSFLGYRFNLKVAVRQLAP